MSLPNKPAGDKGCVKRPEWLTLDEGGGVLFGIAITVSEQQRHQARFAVNGGTPSESPTESDSPVGERMPTPTEKLVGSFTNWVIDYARLDVRGKTR